LVDLPTTKAAGPGYLGRLLAAQHRPVVPLWLKSVAELKTAAAWVARHYAHSVGYHALRSPVYAARLTLQAPSGAAKFVGGTMRWAADREGEPVRLAAVRREDAAEYLKLSRQRDGRVRLRALVTVLAMFTGLGAALALYVLAPDWLQAVSVGAVVMALGVAGRKADPRSSTARWNCPRRSSSPQTSCCGRSVSPPSTRRRATGATGSSSPSKRHRGRARWSA
jgi:S-DNA-T family DNA segregation ATPase FtsK/SpoIIIE